jgi:putative protease
LPAVEEHIKWLKAKAQPDAIIAADPGIIQMIREIYPECPIHLSVQQNNLNWRQIKFWQNFGVERVILSRELRLQEIQEIHEMVPEMELECFVHGAICVAYSGRCLISNYMAARDPNYGTCSHSCRWKYKVYLEEEKRPGEFYPMEEDDDGSYLMNAKDLCLMPYLKDLRDAGVCSFKIEGRSKTDYYAATTAKYYRMAIDDMMAGKEFNPELLQKIRRTSHRPDIPGFLFGNPKEDGIYYPKNGSINEWHYIGFVTKNLGENKYEIEIKNRIMKGTSVEIVTPNEDFETSVVEISDVESGEKTGLAHGGAGFAIIEFERSDIEIGSFIRQKAEVSKKLEA